MFSIYNSVENTHDKKCIHTYVRVFLTKTNRILDLYCIFKKEKLSFIFDVDTLNDLHDPFQYKLVQKIRKSCQHSRNVDNFIKSIEILNKYQRVGFAKANLKIYNIIKKVNTTQT